MKKMDDKSFFLIPDFFRLNWKMGKVDNVRLSNLENFDFKQGV